MGLRWLAIAGCVASAVFAWTAPPEERPAEWDDEEDGVWEPAPWENVWWTKAGEDGVKFIEDYDARETAMVYRYNGFRRSGGAAVSFATTRRARVVAMT